MSYLDVPRILFSGKFGADPSTVDNVHANYSPTSTLDLQWNPNGKHIFSFENCTVKSVMDTGGPASGDALVDGVLTCDRGRLVDIDTDYQTASQIWGADVSVALKGGAAAFNGTLLLPTLRDLWMNRIFPLPSAEKNFTRSFSGIFQTVLTGVKFNSTSGVLAGLSNRSQAAGDKLSIRFVLFNYNADSGSPLFTHGNLLGAIGPVIGAEPEHFAAERRLINPGSSYFHAAPFKVDATRKKLVIDLAHAIPEHRDLTRISVGPLTPRIMEKTLVPLHTIDYVGSAFDTNAGVMEVDVTPQQITSLKTHTLTLATGTNGLVLEERPSGLYVDSTEIAFRLNAHESRTIELVATQFGTLKAGVVIGLLLLQGQPASGIAFPASVTTGANGRASVKFDAGNPGNPRGFIDGQVYQVGYFFGPGSINPGGSLPSNYIDKIIIKVFDEFAPVTAPTWTANVKPIFQEFSRLYPAMKARFDLADFAQVQSRVVIIKAFMQMPQTDFSYMPVSRDLSKGKIDMIIKWIDAGAPL